LASVWCELAVTFNNDKIHRYSNMPLSGFGNFRDAESVGKQHSLYLTPFFKQAA
jgi:hypothetical protein